ncbi:MAG: biopolymer transporter ExbD [Muribaculaceae bacterium]|nr:biopolymer transporter ExbD [Muribaculaceae bacterium]
MEMNTVNKPTQVMAWLGFGISAALFVLVWIVNMLVMTQLGESNNSSAGFAALYMLLILIGSILGILALVFSIVGLVTANKHGLKKLPGILGITLCCLSLISVLTPFIYAVLVEPEPVEVIVPPSEEETTEDVDVILSIGNYGDVKCYKADGSNTANMNALIKYRFSRELKTWLQTNGFSKDVSITIKADKDVDYSYVANVIDALNDLGINRFKILSDNS